MAQLIITCRFCGWPWRWRDEDGMRLSSAGNVAYYAKREIAMNRYGTLILLLFATSLTLSCGSSSRQLQSITTKATVNGQQLQFVATGTFSAPPLTVSPLPVSWSFAPPPGEYSLTTQPFTFQCDAAGEYGGPIVAMAPADPSAPSQGPILNMKMITTSGPIACPESSPDAR